MTYTVVMQQVAVFYRERDSAERTVRRVLEERLGGPGGVMSSFLTSFEVVADARCGVPIGASRQQREAVLCWQAAVEAALEAVHDEFPALVLRIDAAELEEVLADEFISIDLIPSVTASGPVRAAICSLRGGR